MFGLWPRSDQELMTPYPHDSGQAEESLGATESSRTSWERRSQRCRRWCDERSPERQRKEKGRSFQTPTGKYSHLVYTLYVCMRTGQ